MPDYKVYVARSGELLTSEESLIRTISELKGSRRRRDKRTLEEAETQLKALREESGRFCTMLDDYREREEDKMMMRFDEVPQIYNEVIGICYRKAILYVDDGTLRWFECDESVDGVAIGDTELDDGLLLPFSDIPSGERKMILSYLIEAGSTPIHYLDFLQEELNR